MFDIENQMTKMRKIANDGDEQLIGHASNLLESETSSDESVSSSD
jgi:hypothetical protein